MDKPIRNKLVRDNVPEILKQRGESPIFHVASKDEYWHALLAKLEEETAEFLDNPNEAEFSDVLELVDEITKVYGEDRVREIRDLKAQKRGTFSKHIILDNMPEPK